MGEGEGEGVGGAAAEGRVSRRASVRSGRGLGALRFRFSWGGAPFQSRSSLGSNVTAPATALRQNDA